jgi:hypothetical protein
MYVCMYAFAVVGVDVSSWWRLVLHH